MRFALTLNFILLGACLAQYQGQPSLFVRSPSSAATANGTQSTAPPDHSKRPGGPRARGLAARDQFPKLIARADASNGSSGGTPDKNKRPGGPRARGLAARDQFPKLLARADSSNGSTGGNTPPSGSGTRPGSGGGSGPIGYPNVKDPKICAAILKAMKEAESKSQGGSPTGPKGPSAGMTSTPKPSGAIRRSRITQNPDLHLVRRADPPAPSASASASGAPAAGQSTADPNSCKEMQDLIKSNREKMAKGLKSGSTPTKKEVGPADSKASTDSKSSTNTKPPADKPAADKPSSDKAKPSPDSKPESSP